MTEQIKALQLADALDVVWAGGIAPEAAAELRRQHEEIDQWRVAVTNAERERDIAGSQRDALLAALKKAEENGCSTVYANEYDECGAKGCCGVVSYKPHADDCWVTMARAAIEAVEENT